MVLLHGAFRRPEAGPPNHRRRGFAAASHVLPPQPSPCAATGQPRASSGMSAPLRSARHGTTRGILPLAQSSSSAGSLSVLTARVRATRIRRCRAHIGTGPHARGAARAGRLRLYREVRSPVRITEVSTLKLRFSMATPMADAIHYMPERNLLLVQITTDDGLVGTRRMCCLRWLPGQHGARRARRPAAIAHRRRPLSRRAALEPDGTALASTRHDRHADASHQRGRYRPLGPHRPGHADAALPVAWRLPGHARRLRLGRVLRRWQRIWPSLPKRSAATPNAGSARSR